ncbi:MAG TPA: hypothetical protein VJP39_01330 [Gaiellaceae bacterium]|nr:hypothetical protein [Gaiellaceae bacterium]
MQAVRRGAVVATLALAASLSARPAPAVTTGCVRPADRALTTLTADGNLYVVVRSAQRRYIFGWSDQPVLSIPQALRLARALGFKGTDAQLFRRLSGDAIPGANFSDAGSIGDFTFACQGTYTATAVVRSNHGAITATRFWLQQGGLHVTRAFCMPEQWVRAGAWVSVKFHVPLATDAPVFTIDWNHDGKVDSVGPFRPGGGQFPTSDRC